MKFLLTFFLFLSGSVFAAEKYCEIKMNAKQTNSYGSWYEADQNCRQYHETLGCHIVQTDRGWNSVIDFEEVFSGTNSDYQKARTQAYRGFFDAVEQRGYYKYPLNFNIKFNCKNY